MTTRTLTYVGGPIGGRSVQVATPIDRGDARRRGYELVTAPDNVDGMAVWSGGDSTAVRRIDYRIALDAEVTLRHQGGAEMVAHGAAEGIREAVRVGAHPASLTVRVVPWTHLGNTALAVEVRGYATAPYPKETDR